MNEAELKQTVEQYSPSVYRLAYARTGNHADAEDVMQEAFLRLVRSHTVFHEGEHCKAWLLRVTVNCANSLLRSPWQRRTQALDETLPAAELAPDLAAVQDAVQALPERYRAAVHLFYYEGYSARETGEILGKSEQAVKNLLFRARDRLREELKGVAEDV